MLGISDFCYIYEESSSRMGKHARRSDETFSCSVAMRNVLPDWTIIVLMFFFDKDFCTLENPFHNKKIVFYFWT